MSEFYPDTDESIDYSYLNRIKSKYPNQRIGFTCSCFDLLHCGHALMLEDCKKQCDVLVIGLQTDPTIDRKNKNKPVQTYEERKIMVSSIKYVDEIIEYDTEKQLYQILCYLNPDVRILGSDWQGKEYTGFELPIQIYWHNRTHNWSTSNLRERIYQAQYKKHNRI